MKSNPLFSVCLFAAFLVSAPLRGETMSACAHKTTGQVRVSASGACLPSETALTLAKPRPIPDILAIPAAQFVGLNSGLGNDARGNPSGSTFVIRATVRADQDSRERVSVRAQNSWEIDPNYVYDAFFICLGFSNEISDAEGLTVFLEHTKYGRDLPSSPIVGTRDFARLNSTVGDFRAGTPSQGSGASCLTFPLSQLIKTPSFPYGTIGDRIEGPGILTVTLDTPEMVPTRPSGPVVLESTIVTGLGLTVAGLKPAQ
jgi:hypothetical protein